MNRDELSDDANLYFDHYAVISYIAAELRPAAEEDVRLKLKKVVEQLRKAVDDHESFDWLDDGPLTLSIYPSKKWAENDDADVCVFLELEPNFRDTNKPSQYGICCEDHKKLLNALKDAHSEEEDWIEDFSLAHGRKKSNQFFRELDWHDSYDTFDDMAKSLAADLVAVTNDLRSFLKDQGFKPN